MQMAGEKEKKEAVEKEEKPAEEGVEKKEESREEAKDAKEYPKGKTEKKKREKKLKSALYEASGKELKRKNKFCPKCGPGIFLAAHKDRFSCGKCGYTEKKG